ncbi:hypothetical protein AVEN_56039-1 [Araneus ventricosus]|uniref:Uncharacterized protein n=1 Tax=Araneus ventricosus TaxID=182803 RepID=A0A4Y2DLP6_ARAVE|nr:hypothetical protein AVEN_56039-1 [Araneus ventricosus]
MPSFPTKYVLGPLWPSGKASALGPEGPDRNPDSTEDQPCMWACCTLNQTQGAKCPFADVARKLGPSSGVVLVIKSRFKITKSV